MNNRKYQFSRFSFYDYDGIRAHLESLSEQGWVVDKITNFRWRYRRVEPKRRHVAVTYFPEASDFNPRPTEGQETFLDLCENAGWRLAAQRAQMQIFYSEDPEPVPMDTDPAAQVETIHRSMKKNFLPGSVFVLILAVLECGFCLWRLWDDPVRQLSSGSALFSLLCWPLLAVGQGAELWAYLRWHRRAKAAAEQGLWTSSPGSRSRLWAWMTLVIVFLLLAVYASASRQTLVIGLTALVMVTLIILLVSGLRDALRGLGTPAGFNRAASAVLAVVLSFAVTAGGALLVLKGVRNGWLEDHAPAETYQYHGITWEVYHDDLPLTVEDLTDVDYDGYSTELDTASTFLVTHRTARQEGRLDGPNVPELWYTVTDVHWKPVYGLCRRGLLREYAQYNDPDVPEFWNEYRPTDAALWGAPEAYRQYTGGEAENQFLLCYPDRLVSIRFLGNWEPTAEQMAAVGEKLSGA